MVAGFHVLLGSLEKEDGVRSTCRGNTFSETIVACKFMLLPSASPSSLNTHILFGVRAFEVTGLTSKLGCAISRDLNVSGQ